MAASLCRIGIWVTLLLAGGNAVLYGLVISVRGLTGTPLRADWATIPWHVRLPLWFHTSAVWLGLAAVVTVPAIVAYARASAGRPSTKLFVLYSIGIAALALCTVGCCAYLFSLGLISVSSGSGMMLQRSDLLASGAWAATMLSPMIWWWLVTALTRAREP